MNIKYAPFLLFVLFLATFSLNSCQKPGQNRPTKGDSKSEPIPFTAYSIEDSGKLDTLASGLIIYTVEKGPGSIPPQGSHVFVHYLGTLENGEVFDSSYERGEPLGFNVGKGKVIRGWDEGISRLTYGSKAILIIPPDLGYGKSGYPPNIPGNSTLIFHVELLGAF